MRTALDVPVRSRPQHPVYNAIRGRRVPPTENVPWNAEFHDEPTLFISGSAVMASEVRAEPNQIGRRIARLDQPRINHCLTAAIDATKLPPNKGETK
jgi:hypothetical protein